MLDFISNYLHLEALLPRLIAFMLAMTIHDVVHSLVALSLGDRTAKEQGRVSLNPLAHIDVLGLAMTLFGPYGWSKSLPVHMDNFKKSPRLKITLVYLSGPLANLLLVFLCWWLYFSIPGYFSGMQSYNLEIWKTFMQYGVIVNLMLFIIHLLPIYPLDGWYIVKGLFGKDKQDWFMKNERVGLVIIILLMVTPVGQKLFGWIYPLAAQFVMNVFSI
jgi:Zn-dependent protease